MKCTRCCRQQALGTWGAVYFFTTEGMKTQFMNGNPQVCLQVEEITDISHWRSVMVIGRAERLTNPSEIERAAKQIEFSRPDQ